MPATADAKLATGVQSVLDTVPGPRGMKTKVREQPGRSVKQTLVKANPFPRESCGRELCPWGRRGEQCKERCYRENVGYVARCLECRRNQVVEEGKGDTQVKDRAYTGESSRCVVTRIGSHLTDFRQVMAKAARRNAKDREDRSGQEEDQEGEEAAKLSSWMADHCGEYHGGREVTFDFHVTGTFRKPLYRQVDEADRIEEGERKGEVQMGKDKWKVSLPLLNRKHEYYAPRTMQYNFCNLGRVRQPG